MPNNPEHPYFNTPVEIVDPEEIRKAAIEKTKRREEFLNQEKGKEDDDNKKPA
jgi:hypothetical protein